MHRPFRFRLRQKISAHSKRPAQFEKLIFFGGDGAENRFAATHYYAWSPKFPDFVNLIDRAGEESNGKRILKYRNGARFAGNKYRALGAFRSTGDALLGYFLDVKTNDFYSIQFDEEGSPQEKDVTRLTDFGEKKNYILVLRGR